MQLTPEQLDIAARKLCELLKATEPFEVTLIEACRIRIDGILRDTKPIAAIIHAVTSEKKNEEVSE